MKNRLSKTTKLGCALAPINITVGALLIYVVLAIFLGSFGDAFSFIAFSVICTLGVSLILWIPACYVVGYLPVLLFRLLMTASSKSDTGTRPAASKKKTLQALSDRLKADSATGGLEPTHDQQALLDYVDKASLKGLSREQITSNLRQNGWNMDSINWAFNFVKSGGGA